MQRTRIIGLAAALLIASGAVVALRDSRTHDSTPTEATAAIDKAGAPTPRQSYGEDALASVASNGTAASGGGGATQPQSAVTPTGPRVVKTANITLSVTKNDAVAALADRIAGVAAAHSGYVASTETVRDDSAASTVTVRVPAAQYDSALSELRKLGKVSNESFGGQDVTGQLVDLDARLRSLRAQEQALNTLMAKANTVGETLQVAQATADVRTQIEQLAAQQAQLADQADFATITARVLGPNAPSTGPHAEPLLITSLERATAGTLNVFGGMIIVLGYVIPAAILLALGIGLARLVNRRRQGGTPAEPAVA